ncbi:MAG: T9SS type A sorting domain-containing protein, partial [Saprospiraceae bacterium]|nr:T9SS type A sorting domain-containing protein [Saprospiraceae bacterium]
FYSIRFRSGLDSIANGQSATFEFTLPAQSVPLFFEITSRLAPQTFVAAHLNTFNCPVGVTQNRDRETEFITLEAVPAEKTLTIFPNPNNGELYADLSDWAGQEVDVRVIDGQGKLIKSLKMKAETNPEFIALPPAVANGLYFMEVIGETGEKDVVRFIKE